MKKQIYKKQNNLPKEITSGYFIFSRQQKILTQIPNIFTYDVCSAKTGEYIFTIPILDYIRYSPRFCADFSLIEFDQKDLVYKLFPRARNSSWRAETWEELFQYFDTFLNKRVYEDLGYWFEE